MLNFVTFKLIRIFEKNMNEEVCAAIIRIFFADEEHVTLLLDVMEDFASLSFEINRHLSCKFKVVSALIYDVFSQQSITIAQLLHSATQAYLLEDNWRLEFTQQGMRAGYTKL